MVSMTPVLVTSKIIVSPENTIIRDDGYLRLNIKNLFLVDMTVNIRIDGTDVRTNVSLPSGSNTLIQISASDYGQAEGYHTLEVYDANNGTIYHRMEFYHYNSSTNVVKFVDENDNELVGNIAIIDPEHGEFLKLYGNYTASIAKPSTAKRLLYIFMKKNNDGTFYYGIADISDNTSDTIVKLRRTTKAYLHLKFQIPLNNVGAIIALTGLPYLWYEQHLGLLASLEAIARKLGLPVYSIDYSIDETNIYITFIVEINYNNVSLWVTKVVTIGGLIALILLIVTVGKLVEVYLNTQAIISTNDARTKITSAVTECITSCYTDDSLSDEQKQECAEACKAFGESVTNTLQPPPSGGGGLPSWFWTLLAILVLVGVIMMFRR